MATPGDHVDENLAGVVGAGERAELVDELVVVGEGGDEGGVGGEEMVEKAEGEVGGASGEEAAEKGVAGAVVGNPARGEGENEAVVSLDEAARRTERVHKSGEPEGAAVVGLRDPVAGA